MPIMKRVIVWGMGNYYQYSKSWLSDVEIVAFVNDEQYCQVEEFEGKPVIRSTQIHNYEFEELIIAVANIYKILPNILKLDIKQKITKLIYKENFRNLDENRERLQIYFCNIPNFGDTLNSYIIDNLFNVNVVESFVETADIIAIGSILDVLLEDRMRQYPIKISTKPLQVWGTGFKIQPKDGARLIRTVNVSAVRGKLTLKALEGILEKKIECVLADPGLLVSTLYKKRQKRYEVGIVPHHTQINEQSIVNATKYYSNCVIIDVTQNPSDVINKIAECEIIISTSLHGLIIADSFGIPNQWCVMSDKLVGGRFKFDDYYSSYDLQLNPVDVEERYPEVEEVIRNYQINHDVVKKKQEELLGSFPSGRTH